MNVNDEQLEFWIKHLDLLEAVKHSFKNKTVLNYGCDNGFLAENIRRFGASSVTARNLTYQDFAHCYFPNITINNDDQVLPYDIVVLMGTEYFTDHFNLIKQITSQAQERIFLLTNFGAETTNSIIGCNFGKEYLQMPNLSWFVEMFQTQDFFIDNVVKYKTQYYNQEMMFLSVYNSKIIESTPIDLEQEYMWSE
jgi:hypothetical protein